MGKEKYGFIELYFKELNNEPFADYKEQWKAFEKFIDMLCMIALVNREEEEDCLTRIGCLLNDKDLMKTIEPHNEVEFPMWQEVRNIFATLLKKGEVKNFEEGILPMWQFLNAGTLAPMEIMAMLLSAAMDLNRKYERVFGILMEETNAVHKPTFGFVHDMCRYFLTEEECNPLILMNEDSNFRRFIMKKVEARDDASAMSTPVILNPRILNFINGEIPTDLGRLNICCEELEEFEELPEYIIDDELFEDILDIYSAIIGTKAQGVLYLEAGRGYGLSFLLSCLSSVAYKTVLQVDYRKLAILNSRDLEDVISDIVWKCIFEESMLFLDHFEWKKEESSYILSRLQKDLRFFIIGGEKNVLFELPLKGELVHRTLKRPGINAQRILWKEFEEGLRTVFEEDFIDTLVSKYNLTPGQIKSVMTNARMNADINEEKVFVLTQSSIEREIRQISAPQFGESAVKLVSPFTMEDLQLAEESKNQLKDAMNRITYRNRVLDDYGFGKKLPYGTGVSIVFYGPPGTGKTMSAQVLANELGLELYRIDLSQVSSKYIGETEKNLGKVFAAAEGSNAILFFDEADALFAKRTEVSSSNDKHANAEVAYLLQKIEAYTGISILATNGVQNFDAAFKRRMTFMIPIQVLDEQARLELWNKIFPKETPIAEDINFELFAREAELSGSSIKSAALSAAFRAAAENREVTNVDIAMAVNNEYVKIGHMPIFNQMMLQAGMISK